MLLPRQGAWGKRGHNWSPHHKNTYKTRREQTELRYLLSPNCVSTNKRTPANKGLCENPHCIQVQFSSSAAVLFLSTLPSPTAPIITVSDTRFPRLDPLCFLCGFLLSLPARQRLPSMPPSSAGSTAASATTPFSIALARSSTRSASSSTRWSICSNVFTGYRPVDDASWRFEGNHSTTSAYNKKKGISRNCRTS